MGYGLSAAAGGFPRCSLMSKQANKSESFVLPARRDEHDNLRPKRRSSLPTHSARSTPRYMQPTEMITAALAVGVPLFNSGDAGGCAAVYANCAASLLDEAGLPHTARERLARGLDQASDSVDARMRAWAMRHALDDVLTKLRGGGAEGQQQPQGEAVLDFADGALQWAVVDDRVMGGSSRSRMSVTKGVASFEGELVTAGGGFASVRVAPPRAQLARGLAAASGLLLRSGGSDGRSGYKLTLKTDAAMDGISYQAPLEPAAALAADGGTVRIPFSMFRATFRGRPVPNAPPLRGEDVQQLGVMLSRYEVSGTTTNVPAGRFQLRLRSLEAYHDG